MCLRVCCSAYFVWKPRVFPPRELSCRQSAARGFAVVWDTGAVAGQAGDLFVASLTLCSISPTFRTAFLPCLYSFFPYENACSAIPLRSSAIPPQRSRT